MPNLSALLSRYGMVLVLLALCLFYAFMTMAEQNPRGADAAAAIADDLREAAGEGAVVLVTKANAEHQQFADALGAMLRDAGVPVTGVVRGEPTEIREGLEALAATGVAVAAIGTPQDYATIVGNITSRIPPLAGAKITAPRSYRWPTFLLANNLRNVANQIVVIAILAVGMTMVIITAGIDLSVGSLIALSAVVAAWIIRAMGGADASLGVMLFASVSAILMCGMVGFVSGMTITQFKVPPFITTLAVMLVASGFAYIISRGESIYEVPDSYVWLGRGADLFSIPNAVILMAVIYLLAHILMTRTTLGRYIYAVGGNPEAARLSGIRVNSVLLFVYTVGGMLAGLGGIVQASQLKSGAPTYGLLYELYVIAAVVVGGTSLAGGEGRIMGTLVGALIIAVIQNGMNLTGVESYTQKVVLGMVILVAVLLDMLKKRSWRVKKATA
ncbi:MAG: ABC transporter permease [Rhodothermales bacterium]|nr:ABC transporter permease [Rhodothermales bacterium]